MTQTIIFCHWALTPHSGWFPILVECFAYSQIMFLLLLFFETISWCHHNCHYQLFNQMIFKQMEMATSFEVDAILWKRIFWNGSCCCFEFAANFIDIGQEWEAVLRILSNEGIFVLQGDRVHAPVEPIQRWVVLVLLGLLHSLVPKDGLQRPVQAVFSALSRELHVAPHWWLRRPSRPDQILALRRRLGGGLRRQSQPRSSNVLALLGSLLPIILRFTGFSLGDVRFFRLWLFLGSYTQVLLWVSEGIVRYCRIVGERLAHVQWGFTVTSVKYDFVVEAAPALLWFWLDWMAFTEFSWLSLAFTEFHSLFRLFV